MTNKRNKTITWKPLFPSAEEIKRQDELIEIFINNYRIDPDFHSDYYLAWQFLSETTDVINSFTSYRREIERFIHWSWYSLEKSLKFLTKKDIHSYIDDVKDPDPSWISDEQQKRFESKMIPNLKWRPFSLQQVASKKKIKIKDLKKSENLKLKKEYILSSSSQKIILAVLSSFYEFLVYEDYCSSNIVREITRPRKKKMIKTSIQQTSNITTKLSKIQWHYCLCSAKELAKLSPKKHERTVFIVVMLCRLYLRISELVPRRSKINTNEIITPTMGDFIYDSDSEVWYFRIKESKGAKDRDVVVDRQSIEVLKHYRNFLGLSDLPRHNEQTPILPKLKGKGAIRDTRQVRNIVKNCFDYTISNLIRDGYEDEAKLLEDATPHWLRHTGISQDVNHPENPRPLPHVQIDAGHSTLATTGHYANSNLIERSDSKNKVNT